MLTSLQALLRLAILRWLGVLFCALAVLLAAANTASALEPLQTKTRVWGFDFAADNSAGLFRAASLRTHPENSSASPEAASGSLLAARGAAAARQLGQAGEAAAGIVKNTERIASATGTASYRIPDILNHSTRVIGDVKNVGSLSYTSQLRDFAAYARANNYTFELFVRPTTQLSGPLQQAASNGEIVLRFLP